jgi:alpha-1,3-fucosyltransferase
LDYWDYPDFFNLTMTYRLDSDIVFAYGKTIDIESGVKVAPGTDIKWRHPIENFTGRI